jgi:hypothetical protein
MTRDQAETAILDKLKEIREIMAQYTTRDNLMLCVYDGRYSLWNCQMSETEGVLDCSEFDGRLISWEHGKKGDGHAEDEAV